MGSYTFPRPPPDTRAYVTGVCSKPFGDCEFDVRYTRPEDRPRRIEDRPRRTREATDPRCGCGAPLTDVQPITATT